MWKPRIDRKAGPIYTSLATAIAADVQAGRLNPGDRLPPQRELADALGVTVTTVTRGYAEAERLGLVSGEVGRGTFVRPPAFAPLRTREPGVVDLATNALLPYSLSVAELGRRAEIERRTGALAELLVQGIAASPRSRRSTSSHRTPSRRIP